MPHQEVTPEEAKRILKDQADKVEAGKARADRVKIDEVKRIIENEKGN